MIVIDAGVLIAHLTPGDKHQVDALAMLDTDDELAMHALNMSEVLVHAAREQRAAELRDFIRVIGIAVAPSQGDEPLELALLRAETRLKMPDCCVLLAAEQLGATLATFDAKLAESARARGLSVIGVDAAENVGGDPLAAFVAGQQR